MIHQKKIIEMIESREYRQHATNKKLWYKPVGNIKYTVNISGVEPVIKMLVNGEEIFEDENEELVKVQEEINEIIGKTAPDQEPADETLSDHPDDSAVEIKCELCSTAYQKDEMAQVGFPVTHDVCQVCAEKITTGDIDISNWYPEPAEEIRIAEDAIPDETLVEQEELPPSEIDTSTTDEELLPEPVISTRICNIKPELAERGKIKIGGKGEERTGKGGKTYRLPIKSDHFTIVTTGKDENGNFIVDQEIMDKIGTNCTELDIMVLYNNPDLIFRTSYAFFNSAKCECRGDGKSAITLKGDVIECNPETCETFKEKACKPNGVLSVILMDAPRVGGVYKFRTTSWNTIRNITSSLDMLKAQTYGQLAGLPLVLTLQPKTVVIPNTSKTTVIYMANIEFKGSMNELLNKTMQIANQNADVMNEIKRIENNAKLMLNEAPSPEECNEIVDEFYPDTKLKEIGANNGS